MCVPRARVRYRASSSVNWRPYRDGSRLRVALGLALAVVAVGVIALAFTRTRAASRALTRLTALPRASVRAPVRGGPAVYTGVLSGPSSRRTGQLFASAAYVGWVTETSGSGKNRYTRRVCAAHGEVDQLTLESDGARVA